MRIYQSFTDKEGLKQGPGKKQMGIKVGSQETGKGESKEINISKTRRTKKSKQQRTKRRGRKTIMKEIWEMKEYKGN